MITPSFLKPGDTIGVIAPAGQIRDKELVYNGVRLLKEFGVNVVIPRELWPGKAYLSDTDENRAKEFQQMWVDDNIDAIICLRGGFGVLRILPFLDLKELKKYNKFLIGFSDISLLQNYLAVQIGVQSIHGPVLTSLSQIEPESIKKTMLILGGRINTAFENERIEILKTGETCTGQIMGGNMTSLTTVLGTSFDFSWDDKVLFLEEIGEPLYKIDRLITQLALAGKFNKIKALVLGDFTYRQDDSVSDKTKYKEDVWNLFLNTFINRNIPILAGLNSGHGKINNPFIIGSYCHIPAGKAKIEILKKD
ncbi:MAG: LD-carboxypeptidase [Desulfotalea sp.]